MSIVLIVVLSVILLDNLLGISFHYRINNKMDELEKVNALIQNPSSDSITKSNAVSLRQEILARKSIFDYLFLRNSSATLRNAKTNSPAQIPRPKESMNYFVYVMSTGGFIILFGLTFCAIDFLYSDENRLILRFATALSFFFSPFVIAMFLMIALNFVPTFGHNASGNAVLNFFVQINVLACILVFFIRYYQRRIAWMKNRKEALEVDEQELGHS
jgi:hypothetical protein